VRALRPEVVLLDIQLADLDGFAVCEQLVEGEDAPVVVLTRADLARRSHAAQAVESRRHGTGVTRLTNAKDAHWANWGALPQG
jgi:DNA-binding response OmpR family regulator